MSDKKNKKKKNNHLGRQLIIRILMKVFFYSLAAKFHRKIITKQRF